MNEFLKNLRTAQRSGKARPPAGTRKMGEGGFITPQDRRRIPESRQPPAMGFGKDMGPAPVQKDGWHIVGDQLEALCETLERFYQIHEKALNGQIRMQETIVSFFESAGRLIEENRPPENLDIMDTENLRHSTERQMQGERYTKEEVISMIRTMRHDRCTFGEIAAHLKKMGIPTFSGRGEWHAQTIHRLYKK